MTHCELVDRLFSNGRNVYRAEVVEVCFVTITQIYKVTWRVDICKKAKLRNYIQFKEDYITEPYVAFNLKRGQRSLCAQLRSGALPLAVEEGTG